MSPESTHTLLEFYMEGLILGVNTMYMLFCFFKLGCIQGRTKVNDFFNKTQAVNRSAC